MGVEERCMCGSGGEVHVQGVKSCNGEKGG